MAIQSVSTPSGAFGRPDRAGVTRMGALAAASVFTIAGLALIGVGSAFPLAFAVIEARELAIPAAELAFAERLSPFWPALVALGAVNFAAAFAILDRGRFGKRVAMVVAGATAALAVVAEVVLVASRADAASVGVATGVASLFIVAFVATLFVQRRDA